MGRLKAAPTRCGFVIYFFVIFVIFVAFVAY